MSCEPLKTVVFRIGCVQSTKLIDFSYDSRSAPFVVGTWYRPPSSPPNLFSEFEKVIDKIDVENKELYLLGNINCNLLPEANAYNSSYLTNIFDIYMVLVS